MPDDLPTERDLYNGSVETGFRALAALAAMEEAGRGSVAFDDLRVLDLFAVYGEDVGFDRSLQPRVPGYGNAFNFRHERLRETLRELVGYGLADVSPDGEWSISRSGLDLMEEGDFAQTGYGAEIVRVCRGMTGEEALSRLRSLAESIRHADLARPEPDALAFLHEAYARDLVRIEGLRAAVRDLRALRDESESDVEWLDALAALAEREDSRLRHHAREVDALRKQPPARD